MVACFAAPQASVDGLEAVLRDRGFAVLAPAGVAGAGAIPIPMGYSPSG